MPRDEAGVLSEIKRDYIIKKLKEGKRGDGRGLDEFREISIQTNFVPRAAGSAFVKLGRTKIVAGVKIESGEPFPDTPNQGVLTTNVELLPMAFPTFESGPPNENSIEIARVVDRGIRESKMIDLEKLVIEPAKKVYIVFVDINVIDYDGNLIDACTMGVLSALKSAIVPGSKEGGKDFTLPIRNLPVSVTMVKIGDEIVVDPSVEEEQLSSARVTVTISEDGHLRAMQKGDAGSFTLDEIRKAIKISSDTGKLIREKYLQ
ncbi:MAG: exosome complex protein Rrp42 [Candidatus Thermoplasmatota archaeon]|nr:exosome complex protein Rrp42 [Candidatus Thermoplasmatota archaeon]MCL5954798.1 exosome complex protein Rrp42 [Candidatus Thermoplasmatota archaeon]